MLRLICLIGLNCRGLDCGNHRRVNIVRECIHRRALELEIGNFAGDSIVQSNASILTTAQHAATMNTTSSSNTLMSRLEN